MSGVAASQRRRSVLWLAAAAGVAALLGAASFLPPPRPEARVEVGERVLPDFAARADEVALVMVTTSEEAYHLVRNDDAGDGFSGGPSDGPSDGQWVLAEKGSYPVEPDRITELTRALAAISYARPMTRDERKFDRIGLGDPAAGGTGALLEVGDGSGTSFAKLIVGYRDGRSYVRMPDDLQAWAVEGATFPPLHRAAAWLDLDVVDVAAEEIADVLVRPAQGPSYRLVASDDAGQQFTLAPPHALRQPVAPMAPSLAAQALSRFAPIDVARADTVAVGAPLAEYVVRTRSGIAIVVHSWRSEDGAWVTVGAAAAEDASPEAVAESQAINTRAAGWAFGLTALDGKPYSLPLSELVE